MKNCINEQQFKKAFKNAKRDRQFTDQGFSALYEYLILLEDKLGNEIELDVIGLCCDYAEYECIEDFRLDYGEGYIDMDDIEKVTTLIRIDEESFIVQNF